MRSNLNCGALLPSAVFAALLSSTLSWLAGESSLVRFRATESDVNLMGRMIRTPTAQTMKTADERTAILSFMIAGATLGLTVGLASGLACGSRGSAARAGLIGLAAGTILPIPFTWGAMNLHHRLIFSGTDELITSLLTHAVLWIPIGGVAGLALGVASDSRTAVFRSTIGGMLGALAGVLIYEVVGSMLLPLAETGRPIAATSTARWLAFVLLCLPATLLAVALARPAGRPNAVG